MNVFGTFAQLDSHSLMDIVRQRVQLQEYCETKSGGEELAHSSVSLDGGEAAQRAFIAEKLQGLISASSIFQISDSLALNFPLKDSDVHELQNIAQNCGKCVLDEQETRTYLILQA